MIGCMTLARAMWVVALDVEWDSNARRLLLLVPLEGGVEYGTAWEWHLGDGLANGFALVSVMHDAVKVVEVAQL